MKRQRPWEKAGCRFFSGDASLARPAVVAGVSLALMEVLNDYGLARYFGVDTFTTGIFTAWFAFGHAPGALKLSAYLMVFVLVLILLEKFQRRKMRFDVLGSTYRPMRRQPLRGAKALTAFLICLWPLLLGFVFPAMKLVYWSVKTIPQVVDYRFWELLGNSFLLAGIAAVVVVGAALMVAFTVRSFPSAFVRLLARIATLGYALPGAVVAIGILIPFLWIDGYLLQWSGQRLAITGSWFALIYAYMVRFMAVGYNSIESGMESISRSMDEASRSLGVSNKGTLFKIHIPLLRSALLSGGLLVFIDVLKELPLTLILRPFNFDTLAIRAFEFASDERVAEAAPAALVIIMAGMVPVILLHKLMGKEK